MFEKIEYWLRKKFIGSRTDFAEFCWMIKPWPVNLASSAVIIRDEKILLARPKNRSHFYPPGGLIDRNENPQEACMREVEEELRVKIKVIASLSPTIRWNINEAEKINKKRILVVFNYLAEIIGGQVEAVQSENSGMIKEYRWVGLKDFRKLPILPGIKGVFQEGLRLKKQWTITKF